MSAKEYFEGIRAEVASIERSREMLARLRSREGVKAQSYSGGGGGGESDPTDAIDRRIDFEQRLVSRIEESRADVESAGDLLYGSDNRGGLAKAKGARYADVLCMYYLQSMEWGDVAEVMGCTKQWCRELSNAAFRYIDKIGIAALKNI